MNKERLSALYEEENNITRAAKRLAKEENISYTDSFRRKASNLLNKEKVNDLENETVTETNQYSNDKEKPIESFMPSAWDKTLERFLTIDEYCDKYGLNKASVRSSKLVSHVPGHMVYNIAFYTPEDEVVLDINSHLEEVVSKYIKPVERRVTKTRYNEGNWFDRLVFSDTHIAMDVQGNGDPMYDGTWDKTEVLTRLDKMVSHALSYKKSSVLYIDDLGDFLDGLGGETTRKGHKLPQNMNDKEAFDLALEFKISMVETLINHYDEIILNIVTNDNHSGVFAYFAASATKKILEQKYYPSVKVNVLKRFMEHYSVGKHTFVLTHGKDIGEQRYGLKPKLDAVQAEKIDQYCKEHKLYNGNFIELSKGDSHQAVYDDTTSNDFQYYNYPAFSPPSNWVKTNFKNSKSGFRFYSINKEENIKITVPYFF